MRNALFALAAVCAAAFSASSTSAMAAETIQATFTQPDGGVTTGLYDGLVDVTVSGVGQSNGNLFNDAFYQYGNGAPTYNSQYYQLTFGTSTLTGSNPAQDAVNYIVGGLPAYSASHAYSFVLNTFTDVPSQLHFGVGDGEFQDNSGSYTVSISAAPEPGTWMMMILGFGLVGGVMRSAYRKSEENFTRKVRSLATA